MPFLFEETSIKGAFVVVPQLLNDARGFFMETYKQSDFARAGINESFVQANHSCSTRGVLRGMHYQRPPHGQAKLIRVIRGEIFDVIADVRPEAPTRFQWVGMTLSRENRRILYVPNWCAHGFCVMSDEAEVIYMTSTEYAPEQESGILWNDPALAITWPLTSPIVSPRDTQWPALVSAGIAGDR